MLNLGDNVHPILDLGFLEILQLKVASASMNPVTNQGLRDASSNPGLSQSPGMSVCHSTYLAVGTDDSSLNNKL